MLTLLLRKANVIRDVDKSEFRVRLVYFTYLSRAFLYNILEDLRYYYMTFVELIWPLQGPPQVEATRLRLEREKRPEEFSGGGLA